jgi:hypothetical protein
MYNDPNDPGSELIIDDRPPHRSITVRERNSRQINAKLHLQGKATDHIWLMEDGEEPHAIGVRLDSGDSGAVYFTRAQALDLAAQLIDFAEPR